MPLPVVVLSRYKGVMKGGYVYILTNRRNGTLYVGVTSDIAKRAFQHRNGDGSTFTGRHGLKRLVYAEYHDDISSAIQREKNIKHWSRAWKIDLIQSINPDWDDLFLTLNG